MSGRPGRARGLAVVTGGGGGIGEAVCRALHADGWSVAVGYVTRERAQKLATELDKTYPLDTLVQRLQAEVAESKTVACWFASVGAWCRKA